jgi:uncharacterized protein YcnI
MMGRDLPNQKEHNQMQQPFMNRLLIGGVVTLAFASLAFGHIRIAPTESTTGAREKYTMRVPNEKQVTCSKIEGEFPAGLDVYDFEFKPGWKIDFKKNDKGKIIGATWTGRIMPYEFVEFGMLGINPKEATDLVWKFIQYYDDGTKEEFTGPVGSRLPSPVVTLKAPAGK